MQAGKDLSLLFGVSEKQIRTAIDGYIKISSDRNIYRVYDELSVAEIDIIFRSIEKSNGKSGLYDCMRGNKVRVSMERDATKTVKEAVLKENNKVLDGNQPNIDE